MYRVGSASPPLDGEVIWTLDIDYHVPEEQYPLGEHGAQIQIHGASLAVCLLKAKLMCDILNTKELAVVEVLVNLLDMSKVTAKELQDIQDTQDEKNAKSDS